MTSPASQVLVQGDPINRRGFKDASGVPLNAGPVILNGYTSGNTSAPSSSSSLTLSSKANIAFTDFYVVNGGSGSNGVVISGTSTGLQFRRVAIICRGNGFDITTAAGQNSNLLIDQCLIYAGVDCIKLNVNRHTADYDYGITIRNNLLTGGGGGQAVSVNSAGSGTGFGGGAKVYQNTIHKSRIVLANDANLSTSIPIDARYNWAHCNSTALQANTSDQITEDYNVIHAGTARSNVTAGSNSQVGNFANNAPLVELGQSQIWGFTRRPFFEPMAGSPVLGFIPSGASPAQEVVDMFNRPRPAGGGSTSYAVGAMERHDTGTRETTVYDVGPSALKIVGPGDQDIRVPVSPSATVISVKARYDSNHGTTNKPQAILQSQNEIGVSSETKTMTSAADTWETLTFTSFTPTAAGVVTVRLTSRAAAGNGVAYFDTITVS